MNTSIEKEIEELVISDEDMKALEAMQDNLSGGAVFICVTCK